jgi:response regulator RpfG family c-di-GMP phosphodiesterase
MNKILFVDDDPNILAALQRQLRKDYAVDTAAGGLAGLETIDRTGPYAVVVSDMQMPEMSGLELLKRVEALAPDTIRIMLTGNADQATAVEAVNEGHVFRFLNKPCTPDAMAAAIKAGLRQYELITAERDLLENTLSGAVRALSEILSTVNPAMTASSATLREHIRPLTEALQIANPWEIEIASMLANVGYVTVPPAVMLKFTAKMVLTAGEQRMLARIPEISASVVSKIPRMDNVARIILYSRKNFDGSGFPENDCSGQSIPVGARILRVLNDLAQQEAGGAARREALVRMKQRAGAYDPHVVETATAVLAQQSDQSPPKGNEGIPISVEELREGQTLRADVRAPQGGVFVTAGTRVTPFLIESLSNLVRTQQIREPLFVEQPMSA